jgi:fumarate reductase subunit D
LRVPILGTRLGISAAVTPFAILIVGLLLGIGRLKGSAR